MHVSWFIRLTKTFSLVHTFDLLEDKHVDDVTIDDMVLYIIYITNKFYVASLSDGSQIRSKCVWQIIDTLGCALCATFCSYHILTSFVI